MTYSASDNSHDSGEPVELYEFKRGLKGWYFTSSQDSINANGRTYLPTLLKRSDFEMTNEKARSTLTISAPVGFVICEIYRSKPPSEIVSITVLRLHLTDLDRESRVIWKGRVSGVKDLKASSQIVCEPAQTSLKRNGLRRLYSKQCPHVLYSQTQCKIDKNLFSNDLPITARNGLVLTVPGASAFEDNYFSGGVVEFEVEPGVFDRRFIESHTSQSITIDFPVESLKSGVTARFFPGCNHTRSDCRDKFNNLVNYGGQPFIPDRNPMSGAPVF